MNNKVKKRKQAPSNINCPYPKNCGWSEIGCSNLLCCHTTSKSLQFAASIFFPKTKRPLNNKVEG